MNNYDVIKFELNIPINSILRIGNHEKIYIHKKYKQYEEYKFCTVYKVMCDVIICFVMKSGILFSPLASTYLLVYIFPISNCH